MADTTITFGSAVENLLPELREKLTMAEAREAALKALVDEQHQEVMKFRKALSIFDPKYTHPNDSVASKKKKRDRGRNGTGHGITLEALSPIVDLISKVNEDLGYITQTDVLNLMGKDQHPGKVSKAFSTLREVGYLRKTAEKRDNRFVYAIMDKDALNQFGDK